MSLHAKQIKRRCPTAGVLVGALDASSIWIERDPFWRRRRSTGWIDASKKRWMLRKTTMTEKVCATFASVGARRTAVVMFTLA